MSVTKPPRLLGLETAPEHFIEAFQDIQFLGVNTLLIPYKNGPAVVGGEQYRRIPLILRCPTGALPMIHWQLYEFMREHRLVKDHDATRCSVE